MSVISSTAACFLLFRFLACNFHILYLLGELLFEIVDLLDHLVLHVFRHLLLRNAVLRHRLLERLVGHPLLYFFLYEVDVCATLELGRGLI